MIGGMRAERSRISVCAVFSFFFFQAEDGIRDLIVTGVQTCALPISLVGCCRDPVVAGAPFRHAEQQPASVRASASSSLLYEVVVAMMASFPLRLHRSEERRVGEEGRSRWAPDHLKKKETDGCGVAAC